MNMETKSRDGFTFWRSFRDVISHMPEVDQLPIYKAITNFGLDGTEPNVEELSQLGHVAWLAMKPNLQSGWAKSNAGRRGGGAGTGDSKARFGNKNASRTQAECKQNASNKNKNENEELERECVDVQREVAPRAPAKRFTPPTVAEVEAYARKARLRMDAASFVDHYNANGWLVGGRSPMMDWEAAARNWARKDYDRNCSPSLPPQGAPSAQPPLTLFREDGEV